MNILQPGTMFKIIKPTKDSSFGVETLGFISHVEGSSKNFPNVIYYNVVIIRRGRTGKVRLELKQISTPIFTPKCKNIEYILPEIDYKNFVFIDPKYDLVGKSILKFKDQLFLGWVYAYEKYLYRLHTLTTKIRIWPDSGNHVLNTIDKLQNEFASDSQATVETYTTAEFRKIAINEIRHFETMLASCGIDYLCRVVYIEKCAMSAIVTNAKNIKLENIKTAIHNLELIINRLTKLKKISKTRKMVIPQEKGGSCFV